MVTVFIRGVCTHTHSWAEEVVEYLSSRKIEFCNGIYNGNSEPINMEDIEKANVHLYVITSAITDMSLISEALDSADNKDIKTIVQIIPDGFSGAQIKVLSNIGVELTNKGAYATLNSDIKLCLAEVSK